VLTVQPPQFLPYLRPVLRLELRTEAILERRRLGIERPIILRACPAESFDEVGIGYPLKLLHVHDHGFPLSLLDLLGQSLEGLQALITGGEDIDPSSG
jgi:hypothetical protein